MTERETFLGDGLYVSFDGFQLRLRAPREDGDDIIYLEPGVYQSLVNYVADLIEQVKKEIN